MATIETDGREIESEVTDIALREIGFGADEITFKIGGSTVSLTELEFEEIRRAARRRERP